jgi:formylglycine-generating enzyme required for sulfatase activity
MKTKATVAIEPSPTRCSNVTRFGVGAVFLAATLVATAQIHVGPFTTSGWLSATGLEPGTTATVEWAPTVEGPWSSSWSGLTAVTADAGGSIHTSVPMFYRVRGIPANPDPARLAWIPAGTFLMGSPANELERQADGQDETQHEVTISQGFWMGRFEVTQEEYLDLMGTNPSYWRNGTMPLPADSVPGAGGPVTDELRHPVDSVSWFDANLYCSHLTNRELVRGLLPEGYVYRLPTEAEWEYACRAGTGSPFYQGDELRSGMANFRGTAEYDAAVGTVNNAQGLYLGRSTPVGSYPPNAWGLHDMQGNLLEWCHDWHGAYATGPITDPTGPITGTLRAFRGGAWFFRARGCRSAFRSYAAPSASGEAGGFRVVLGRPLN